MLVIVAGFDFRFRFLKLIVVFVKGGRAGQVAAGGVCCGEKIGPVFILFSIKSVALLFFFFCCVPSGHQCITSG